MSARDRTERLPLQRKGSAVAPVQRSYGLCILLLPLHLRERALDQVIVGQFGLESVINRRHFLQSLVRIMGRLQETIRSEAYTVQPIDQFPQAPLHGVATFVPLPSSECVIVDVPFVDEDVLREL